MLQDAASKDATRMGRGAGHGAAAAPRALCGIDVPMKGCKREAVPHTTGGDPATKPQRAEQGRDDDAQRGRAGTPLPKRQRIRGEAEAGEGEKGESSTARGVMCFRGGGVRGIHCSACARGGASAYRRARGRAADVWGLGGVTTRTTQRTPLAAGLPRGGAGRRRHSRRPLQAAAGRSLVCVVGSEVLDCQARDAVLLGVGLRSRQGRGRAQPGMPLSAAATAAAAAAGGARACRLGASGEGEGGSVQDRHGTIPRAPPAGLSKSAALSIPGRYRKKRTCESQNSAGAYTTTVREGA